LEVGLYLKVQINYLKKSNSTIVAVVFIEAGDIGITRARGTTGGFAPSSSPIEVRSGGALEY
jgi:hypothetical protein